MSWPLALLLIFGCLVIFMATGMPIAFAFLITCATASFIFMGGLVGFEQFVASLYYPLVSFILLPCALFILMGNIIFEAGVGEFMVNALDKILGRLPGRLSIIAIGAGVLLGTMIGISGGSIAILGRSLVPEMMKRGYKKPMTLGPVVASGTLAVMIPPSALAVFLGAISRVSIGKLLISIIMPGLLLAVLFTAYIIIRCKLQPSIAPSYVVERVSLLEKVNATVRYILPVGVVIFAAIGSVFMGIATPSEAAALGAVACYILAVLYRRFKWQMIKKSSVATIQITVMVFMIIVGSMSFSKVLAFSGATAGLVELATSLPVPPIVVIIMTQFLVIILGCFVDPGSIIMMTVPLFMPIVSALGYDTLWYATILLLNIQLALITPPFGLDVYTMKALAPPGITLGEVFRSSIPFCAIGFVVMALMMVFPSIALWLPSIMVAR